MIDVKQNGVYMKKILLLSTLTIATQTLASTVDLTSYSDSLTYAQVTNVLATQNANGSWCFGTSVRHDDEGWDHYADGWEVIDLKGNQLGFRELTHPHVNEQPFTRNQCNIKIPSEIATVVVRAKCNQHGYGGKPFIVELHAK